MLAGMRSYFLLSVFLALFATASIPTQAQVNGVPPSVTSFGFGGKITPTPGVRASVTSLGPNGYANSPPIFAGCCTFFVPTSPILTPDGGHHHRRNDRDRDKKNKDRDRDRGGNLVSVSDPVYVPYPVAVPADQEVDQDADDESPDADYVHAPAFRTMSARARRTADSDLAAKDDAADKPEEPAMVQPVIVQPATVLVFKDGHQSDVLNYAIVGDTLFDFADGRTKKILLADLDLTATHKANDDRGVDFQIPASAPRQ